MNDNETSKRQQFSQLFIKFYCVLIILYHLYAVQFGAPEVMIFRPTHVSMLVSLLFLIRRAKKGLDPNFIPWYDWLGAILAWVPSTYIFLNYQTIVWRMPYIRPLATIEYVMAILAILLSLEVVRRIVGLVMPLIFGFFVFHCLFGSYFPGQLRQTGVSLSLLLDHLYMGSSGLYGSVTGIAATFVLMFVLLGAIMEKARGGDMLMNLASGLMGKLKGGPAKAAVLASATFGSISGSAVSNVYATGAFTIPLMIKTGFKPLFAGAVEAVASSLGQLIPPIMGSAAFLIAEFTGNSYLRIVSAAIIPACLFIFAIFMMVHLETMRFNLPTMDKEMVRKARQEALKGIHLLLCLVVLIYLLTRRYTVSYSAYMATLTCLVLSFFSSATRLKIMDIIDGFVLSARRLAPVAGALFVASMIVGTIEVSGLALRITSIIIRMTSGYLLPTLFLVMLISIILGMGLPVAAAYLITSIFAAPALMNLGVQPLAAHFFVFMYAITSTITPPVCMTAYGAASIAGTSLTTTGWAAAKLGIAGYVIPFIMIYNPALLGIGSWVEIVVAIATSIVGVIALAVAVQGYALYETTIPQRILAGLSAIALLLGDPRTILVGVFFLAILVGQQIVLQRQLEKKEVF